MPLRSHIDTDRLDEVETPLRSRFRRISRRNFTPRRILALIPAPALTLALCLVALMIGANEQSEAATDSPDRPTEGETFFSRAVQPILEQRCVSCHGGEARTLGGLDMTTREAIIVGGVSGSAINADEPIDSLLLTKLSYRDADHEMPPTGQLPPAEIETLTAWVTMGMPWPEGFTFATHHGDERPAYNPRDWWAYQPMPRPDEPIDPPVIHPLASDDPNAIVAQNWSQHPIDAFVFDQLAATGLKPNDRADRRTLIRRATFDLIGLPPTPEEVEAFVRDTDVEAWPRLIDRLLDSPHYGERWARHWMDLVRYAETDGYERDAKKLNIWRYRDYLIRSLNDDKPYDQLILEQLAGDQLAEAGLPADQDSLIATGYLRLQVWDDEPADPVQARADYIADIVDTTSFAFLGSSIGCARCHDHKVDPFTQADFYGLYTFFNHITEPRRGNPEAIARDLTDVPRDEDTAAKVADWHQRVRDLNRVIQRIENDFREAYGRPFEPGEVDPIVADSRDSLQPWFFTTDDPGEDWYRQGFSHQDWQTSRGGFGDGLQAKGFTNLWTTPAIWLRRNFRLTELPEGLVLSLAHRGAVEIHLNGIRVYAEDKQQDNPHRRRIQLPAEALSALVLGSNSLAVTCHYPDDGPRFVDVGIYSGIHDPQAAELAAMHHQGAALLGDATYQAYREAHAERQRLESAPPLVAYPASVIAERQGAREAQFLHERGNANVPGEPILASFPGILLPEGADPIAPDARRLPLAQWIASPENPMTARVMANRLWQHHFGRGIVPTSSDFGTLGESPTHPALLDYLAQRLVIDEWSLKSMHRLIMTSEAYQMSSAAQPEALAVDPLNHHFWRFEVRRLSAEEYRDAILTINGSLNPQPYGPSIYTIMPEEVLATASKPDEAWGNSNPDQQNRRSVYIHIKRSLREPFLAAFDQAETDSACPVRFVTTVPTQSLIALNSDFMQRESAKLAERLTGEADNLDDRIRIGLSRVLSRPVTDAEVARHRAFHESLQAKYALSETEALQMLCLTFYNLNEFLYLD